MKDLATPARRGALIRKIAEEGVWSGTLRGYKCQLTKQVPRPKRKSTVMLKSSAKPFIHWEICVRRNWYRGDSTDVFHALADMEQVVLDVVGRKEKRDAEV